MYKYPGTVINIRSSRYFLGSIISVLMLGLDLVNIGLFHGFFLGRVHFFVFDTSGNDENKFKNTVD